MNILQRLIHAHTYELLGRDTRLHEDIGMGTRQTWTHITSRCTGCGKIKYNKVRGGI
jgi:hypothetical protein